MKPKCPKCGHPLDSYATWRGEVESYPFGVTCAKCEWMRMVPRAAIIRLAVESNKPKTCKWTPDEDGNWSPACDPIDALFVFNDGGPRENQMRFCHSCGKPVEVVNG